MNWALIGYRRLQERGYFVQPESGREAIEAIAMLGSPVKAFVRDCCEVKAGLSVDKDDLYSAYCEWCLDEGKKDPGSREWFTRNLNSAVQGLRISRPREGDGTRPRMYEGIALPKQEPPPKKPCTRPEPAKKPTDW